MNMLMVIGSVSKEAMKHISILRWSNLVWTCSCDCDRQICGDARGDSDKM